MDSKKQCSRMWNIDWYFFCVQANKQLITHLGILDQLQVNHTKLPANAMLLYIFDEARSLSAKSFSVLRSELQKLAMEYVFLSFLSTLQFSI